MREREEEREMEQRTLCVLRYHPPNPPPPPPSFVPASKSPEAGRATQLKSCLDNLV